MRYCGIEPFIISAPDAIGQTCHVPGPLGIPAPAKVPVKGPGTQNFRCWGRVCLTSPCHGSGHLTSACLGPSGQPCYWGNHLQFCFQYDLWPHDFTSNQCIICNFLLKSCNLFYHKCFGLFLTHFCSSVTPLDSNNVVEQQGNHL